MTEVRPTVTPWGRGPQWRFWQGPPPGNQAVTGNAERRVAASNRRVPVLSVQKLGFYGNLSLTCISHKCLVSAKYFLRERKRRRKKEEEEKGEGS